MPFPHILRREYIDDEEESEPEYERRQRQNVSNFEMSREQRHIQTNNSKARKEVAFELQADADAANQLQTEDRQARGQRTTRSMSPGKRNVSAVDPHRASEETARRSTSRGPSAGPAPALQKQMERQKEALSRYHGTADPTPPENLTPQERKDNDLDAEVMSTLAGIRKGIAKFCQDVFGKDLLPKDMTESRLKKWLGDIDERNEVEFISFCRAIAEGGGEAATWREVVANGECRFGLSYGIIHRVLVHHVFGSLLFGAPQELLARLEQMEKDQENEDGFYREERRAEHIISYQIQYRVDLNDIEERKIANLKTALQIWMLLEPLFRLDSRNKDQINNELQQALIMIVAKAAQLATLMKKSGKTVLYQFCKVFKDEVADCTRMDVLNFGQLKEEHDKGDGGDYVLIRMVCGDSLYAFRKGGGVMAERILETEEQEQDMGVAPELRHMPRNQYRGRLITAQDGYRAKFLAKSQVVGRLEQTGSQTEMKDLMQAIYCLQEGGCTLQ